jgi:hypothetical protein
VLFLPSFGYDTNTCGQTLVPAFAFSHKYLFTAYQVIHEPDPEFKVLEIVGSVLDLDTSVLRCHSLHFLDLDSNAQSYGSFSSVYTVQKLEFNGILRSSVSRNFAL